MGGKRAAGDRTGDDARQIEHAKTRERSCSLRKRPRRRIAYSFDLHDRNGRDCSRLRMACPFVRRAHRRHHAAVPISFRLESDGFPVFQCRFDRGAHGRAAEKLQNIVAVMRKIHVQPDEASIAGAIGTEQRIADRCRCPAVDRQILLAAEFHRRMPHVDTDGLARCAGAIMQFRRGKADDGDARLRRRADSEGRRENRIIAGEMQIIDRRCISAREPPQLGYRICGRKRRDHSIPNKCGSQSDSAGMYVTMTRKISIVASHGKTATVSSAMPMPVMPEAT